MFQNTLAQLLRNTKIYGVMVFLMLFPMAFLANFSSPGRAVSILGTKILLAHNTLLFWRLVIIFWPDKFKN